MTPEQKQYLSRFGITSPTYSVYRIGAKLVRDRAETYLRGRLLDVGCGTRAKALLVGDLVDEYVGLDHEETPHGLDNVDLIGTAYDIPEADGVFDSVLCTAVLEHLEEPAQALRESIRVLKPGGYALYTAPLFWHLHEEPRDFYRFTRYGCQHLFESAGFEVVEISALSGYWMTFAAESAYYLRAGLRGPLRILSCPLIVAINLIAPVLDRMDRRFNPGTDKWTWMYLVVGRKPLST